MSTRARIGILVADPAGFHVESVYLHSDGYPDHAGSMLVSGFATAELAQALVDAGDLSQIGEGLVDPHTEPYAEKGHHRDEVSKQSHPVDRWPDSSQKFEYVFTGVAWAYRVPGDPLGWHPIVPGADPVVLEPARSLDQVIADGDCGTDVADHEIAAADFALLGRMLVDAGLAGFGEEEDDADAVAWLWRHAALGLGQDGVMPRRIDVARRVAAAVASLYGPVV